MSALRVRPEADRDRAAIHRVVARAFPSDAEARLVETLRGLAERRISLVAEDGGGEVVGHILFTPVEIRSAGGTSHALGLGPMAVMPDLQCRGVGSALVRAGLAACRAGGETVVVVLGHPSYYPRFGFERAWDHGLYYGAPGPNPAFMVCQLQPGALRGRSGEVRYSPAFDGPWDPPPNDSAR